MASVIVRTNAPRQRPELPLSSRIGRASLHALVIGLCLLTIFPLLWMLSTAFKESREVFTPGIRLLPTAPTISNFPEAFRVFPIGWWFFNSAIIAIATTLGKLAVGMQFFARNSESNQLWGPMMATATLATIPPLTLYAVAQRRIISTFVTSGIKG